MENTTFPDYWLARAAEALRDKPPQVQLTASLPDVHIASSLLQKALRRADRDQAHRAGNFLLSADPGRLWRRLVAIAFEDFGFANLDITAQICALASNRLWRHNNGGDAICLSYALDQLVLLPKDRVIDSCYMIAIGLGNRGASSLQNEVRIPGEIAKILDRVAAVVSACEQVVLPRHFRAIIARECEIELAHQVNLGTAKAGFADVLRQGFRSSRCLLPVLLPLVSGVASGRVSATVTAPPIADVCTVPSFALDGYTRIGRTALGILAKRLPRLAKLLLPLPTSATRTKALTALLFAAEGGICTTELSDHPRQYLQAASLSVWAGMPVRWTISGVEVIRDAIPALNTIRQELAPEMIGPRQLELNYGK